MGDVTAHYIKRETNHQYFDDRYEIISTMGRGKSSIVYKAIRYSKNDTIEIDTPPVAIKVLRTLDREQDASIRRIKRESLALLSCVHPNVIRLHDYVARNDLCYLTLEYAKYGDIKKLFSSKEKFLSHKATLKLVQNILSGVSAIHQAGILHRDLKPENILLTEDYQVKICDFSVCLLQGEKAPIQLVSNIVGTMDYLAPECLGNGGYSISSDLYSVAVTCFELLNGYKPFEDKSFSGALHKKNILDFVVSEDVISEFPTIVKFFKKALAPESEMRFQNALDMSHAIEMVIKNLYKDSEVEELQAEVSTFEHIKVINISAAVKEFTRSFLKAGKFFSYSFLITIILFYGISLGLSAKEFMKDRVSVPEISQKNEASLARLLSQKTAFGIIKNLYTKDKLYRYAITPINSNKALFSLLIVGWEPVEISLKEIENNEPLRIQGRGLDILVRFDQAKSNSQWSGKFENILTGTEGDLDLTILNE